MNSPEHNLRRRGKTRLVMAALALGVALAAVLFVIRTHGRQIIVGRKWSATDRVSFDEIDHTAWTQLLQTYVDAAGDVDYSGWKASRTDRHLLDDYLAVLSRADSGQESSREARLAFWINAYNAVTVYGILCEYPTSSIQNHVNRFIGYNIWRDLLLVVGDSRYSLGEIEHGILRQLAEPRIHFALVCASRGCPRLLDRAYTAAELEEQLTSNTRAFFADPNKFSWSTADTPEFRLSPILKWYAEDFGASEADRLRTIAPYLPDEAARLLAEAPQLRVRYLDYDWNLNDQASRPTEAENIDEPPLPPEAEYE